MDLSRIPAALNHAVYLALSAALGRDAIEEGHIRILRALANPSPPPPSSSQDVLYYHLTPEALPPWSENATTEEGYPSFFHYIAVRLNLTFYGPAAAELAWATRDRLYEDGQGNPRQILRQEGIYPVPRPAPPSLIWEEWEKEHRPRADLVIPLRVAVNVTYEGHPEGTVESAPAIQTHL